LVSSEVIDACDYRGEWGGFLTLVPVAQDDDEVESSGGSEVEKKPIALASDSDSKNPRRSGDRDLGSSNLALSERWKKHRTLRKAQSARFVLPSAKADVASLRSDTALLSSSLGLPIFLCENFEKSIVKLVFE
jgi:hypothetical protein